MKKIFGVFSFLLLGGSVFAQTQDAINALSMDYCDSVKQEQLSGKTFVVEPGADKELCVKFINNSDKDLQALLGFSQQALDSIGDRTCNAASADNSFAAMIRDYEPTFIVPAKSGVTKLFHFYAPLGMSGIQHGCIVYSAQDSNQGDGMFKMVYQKLRFLDVYVVGDMNVNKTLVLGDVNFFLNGDELMSAITVTNEGNANQNLTLTGSVENALGFMKEFEFAKDVLFTPKETKTFNISLGKVPFYKGLFSYALYGIHTPQFDFDASILGSDATAPEYFQADGSVFFFSWIALGVLAFILLVIVVFLNAVFKKITNRKLFF